MELAGRLAQFLGGLAPEGVIEAEIEYQGEIAAWDVQPITNAALVGLLKSFEGTDVNHVNAPIVAQERGMRVLSTTMSEGSQYGPAVGIRVSRVDGTRLSVQGALIRRVGDEPRIIAIDQYVTEAVPAGPMLIVTNKDIPGMIAGISAALARGGINIAQMNLSRDYPGGMAISIWNVDTPVNEQTLGAIREVPGILSVKQVILDP
jgi:D-3-phosphoglycerate dehydrogenase